ncbi:AbrB/MazE/SpoVT family DNA-binding domain-containing protein [Variovorax sp. J22R133]|uniref:AbrB/MazE/SpoVT family DNA-binding domain-containing protein n=1 Tax=Variovorax brevis TaxID=3053503 RepID=UPI00257757E7|nr:AbrB/MazE/SpoVT family DNA-binding domain-containing protein [Variovorax sp. J22R133]MDM0116228.1 AbrB/MazE/SpoVT family DNA-binding domain-containing protein [Variovorax sp. J22R133]
MRVAKWGNSLAIRLPSALVRDFSIEEGDEVHVRVGGPRELELTVRPSKKAIVEALRQFEGRAPVDFKFDREEANER